MYKVRNIRACFEPRYMCVGVCWETYECLLYSGIDIYICLIPCFPIEITVVAMANGQ